MFVMAHIGLFCFLLFFFECKSFRLEYDSVEIVGGDPIKIENAPFMAIYRMKGEVHGCGASIVTETFLVTAAHCVYPLGVKQSEIIVGTDNVIKGGESHDIKYAYVHPKNDIHLHDYDVAVLQLVKELVFNAKIKPIKLAEPGWVAGDGAVFQTMGFGVTNTVTNEMSDILLAVDVPYVNDEICSEAYEKVFTDRMICAGRKGKDSCFDDSGGPLRYNDTLIGIVSFGRNCALEGYPGVYAKVSVLRDFIDRIIN